MSVICAATRRLTCLPAGTAALLATTLLASMASGQEVRILGRPTGPFHNYVVMRRWSQREIALKNDGHRPLRVRVGVRFETGGEQFTRDVQLPPHSLRTLRLAVRTPPLRTDGPRPGSPRPAGRQAGFPQQPVTFTLRDLTADQQLAPVTYPAEVIAGRPRHDATPGRDELAEAGHRDYTTVGVMLSSPKTPPAAGHASNAEFTYLRDLRGRPLQNVALLIQPLGYNSRPPNHWFGYDGLDVLIIGQTPWSWLAPAEQTALLDWTRRGGILVITAGEHFGRVLTGELADAAGVVVVGEHRTDSLTVERNQPAGRHGLPTDTGQVDDTSPVTVQPSWPAIHAELMPTSAEVLWRANHLPLLTGNRFGDGTVFVLATGPGVVSDPSLHELWRDVGASLRSEPPLRPDAFASAGMSTLENIAGVRAPGRIWPVGVLVLLAGGVLVSSVLLRRLGRGEITWVVLVPTCLLLAAGFCGWSSMRGSPERLTSIGLISQHAAGRSRIQTLSAYHSGSGGRRVRFSAKLPDGVIRNVGDVLGAAIAQRETRTGWTMYLPAEDIPGGATRALTTDATSAGEPLEARVTLGPAGLVGTVRNHLPEAVTGVVLLAGRRTYRLPAIAAEGQANVRMDDDDLLGRVVYPSPDAPHSGAGGEFTGKLTHTPTDRLRNDLLRRLLTVPSARVRTTDRPTLIAYTPFCRKLPVTPGDEVADTRGWSVITCPLQLNAPRAGTTVRVPAGLVRTEFDALGTGTWDTIHERFLRTQRNGRLLIEAAFPPATGPISRANATLRINLRAADNRMQVFGLRPGWTRRGDQAAGRVELGTFDSVSGTVTVTAKDIERFAKDGRYRFLVTVQRTGASGRSLLEAGTVPTWRLRYVDVILEGQAGE